MIAAEILGYGSLVLVLVVLMGCVYNALFSPNPYYLIEEDPVYTAKDMKRDLDDDVVCQHAIWFNSCSTCLDKEAELLNTYLEKQRQRRL